MGVIVVMCATFGLTVSEAKTDIMCLRTKEMLESTAIFSVEVADQVYNQMDEIVYLGRDVNRNADLSLRSTDAYATHGTASANTLARRLYAGCGSCLRGLWRSWRTRDCLSA